MLDSKFYDVRKSEVRGFFSPRFQGESSNSIILERTDPVWESGQDVQFRLRIRPRGAPVYGNDPLVGTEENLSNHMDSVVIGLFPRHQEFEKLNNVTPTPNDIRKCLREQCSEQMAEAIDAMMFDYLTGEPDNNRSRIF